jgi:hypothetical protein
MSLVPCKECGKEVASTATICPNCGVAYPGAAALGCLEIQRRGQLKASLEKMNIGVNNQLVASLRGGEGVLLDKLGAGNYSFKATIGRSLETEPCEITISAGQTVKIELWVEMGLIKDKLRMRKF